jgi:DNA-binding response OmpR family regulator
MDPAETRLVPTLPDPAVHERVQKPSRALRILVVDDDPLLRTFIAAGLSFDGHDVETANDCRSALKLYEARPFQVVVADLFMPGMNGRDLACAIKQLSSSPPLICMTGASEEMENFPFDLIIRKPFAHSVLREAIDAFCA